MQHNLNKVLQHPEALEEGGHEIEVSTGASRLMHNIGAPGGFLRKEKIISNLLSECGAGTPAGTFGIILPDTIQDAEEWLLGMARCLGWKDWPEVEAGISLPAERLLVYPTSADKSVAKDNIEILRHAIILSRCNEHSYLPGSPMIFSRKRLNRTVQLTAIQQSSYYAME